MNKDHSETEPQPLPRRVVGLRADACLAFANTLGWRGREEPVEGLGNLPDVIRWAEANAGLEAASVQRWLAWVAQEAAGAQSLHAQAIEVREAIYRIFSALASEGPILGADLATLNRTLAEAPGRLELAPAGASYGWQLQPAPFTIPALLAAVLWSAGDLLVKGDHGRIRQCANAQCLWLFVDASKNGTRRWCDMTSCGNRAKARRHYLRRKKV